MDILFHAQSITYLAEKRYDGLKQEQTGEISVPETLPELGRVVDCYGTVLVQNRTADNGSITVSGGIQTCVLYVPASGEGIERLEIWIPFTVTKKKNEYFVDGPLVEKMLGYTNLESEKGFLFFEKFLQEKGINDELIRLGVQEGDTVRMYGFDFDYYK